MEQCTRATLQLGGKVAPEPKQCPAPAKGHVANRVWQSEENNVEAQMGTFRCEMACATRWRVTSRC